MPEFWYQPFKFLECRFTVVEISDLKRTFRLGLRRLMLPGLCCPELLTSEIWRRMSSVTEDTAREQTN